MELFQKINNFFSFNISGWFQTEAKLEKEKAERKNIDGKLKSRIEDIEAKFEDMEVQKIEERSNDSALKEDTDRKIKSLQSDLGWY